GSVVSLSPRLPSHWRSMRFNIGFRGQRYHFEVGRDAIRVRADADTTVKIGSETVALKSGAWKTVNA
ncbi:MAG: hypothetical protein KJP16_09815, partial [Gammaproteobacteria bacterium]|nr:hypothetical protein [Gammaproteobacteria bacterium]